MIQLFLLPRANGLANRVLVFKGMAISRKMIEKERKSEYDLP